MGKELSKRGISFVEPNAFSNTTGARKTQVLNDLKSTVERSFFVPFVFFVDGA
jgi:hypothetical protein